MLITMAQTIHFVRHGEVHNPEKILYGLQPGWRLSDRGNEMAAVIGEWSAKLDYYATQVLGVTFITHGNHLGESHTNS